MTGKRRIFCKVCASLPRYPVTPKVAGSFLTTRERKRCSSFDTKAVFMKRKPSAPVSPKAFVLTARPLMGILQGIR
jgi:hypothetical protein